MKRINKIVEEHVIKTLEERKKELYELIQNEECSGLLFEILWQYNNVRTAIEVLKNDNCQIKNQYIIDELKNYKEVIKAKIKLYNEEDIQERLKKELEETENDIRILQIGAEYEE